MERLLIVEDESLIRQGIRIIIEESDLQVGQIFECKNGEQAWELLQTEKIDAVVTDIKMPKMDGISLVKKMNTLKKTPYIVVISGYDDFSYAVEMLRSGALDYILKPIDNKKLISILHNIDNMLLEGQRQQEEYLSALAIKLRYLLTSDSMGDGGQNAHHAFDVYWGGREYRVICSNHDSFSCENGLVIRNLHGGCVLISEPGYVPPNESMCGISDVYQGGIHLHHAFTEGYNRRKRAFFSVMARFAAEPEQAWSHEIMEKYAYQINNPAALTELLRKCAVWAHKYERFGEFQFFAQCIINNMHEILENGAIIETKDMYSLENVNEYISMLSRRIEEASLIREQDSITRQKMREAVRYIHENYWKPLNMTIVSNQVSMNYTLFSNSFKQYTDKNFITYLRELRIERAKQLLRTSDKKIKEISKLVGYEDEKRFMKIFKQFCGIPPKEYKMNTVKKTDPKKLAEDGYTLVFSDEFNYEGAPSSHKWDFETGNHQWPNQELQAYTCRPDNVTVKDGRLILTAKKEKDGEREYTSAKIVSKDAWQHGKIMVSAKLPKGAGSWPAIWMLPVDMRNGVPWPLCGEIDIMEHVGRTEDDLLFSLHSKRYNHMDGTPHTTESHVKGVCERFHVYAIEWTASYIEFFVDDISYAKYSINDNKEDQGIESWPFNKPFYLIINIAVGGTLGGPVDEKTLPYSMEVDYVRVYQKR